jgi:hypothetical protein
MKNKGLRRFVSRPFKGEMNAVFASRSKWPWGNGLRELA